MCRPRRHIARRLRLSNHLGSLTRSSGSDLARVVWYLAEHDLRIRLSHVHSFYDEDLHGQEQHFLLIWELAERADICCSGMADAPADYEENPPSPANLSATSRERLVDANAFHCARSP